MLEFQVYVSLNCKHVLPYSNIPLNHAQRLKFASFIINYTIDDNATAHRPGEEIKARRIPQRLTYYRKPCYCQRRKEQQAWIL
jgi:hypothetical protein